MYFCKRNLPKERVHAINIMGTGCRVRAFVVPVCGRWNGKECFHADGKKNTLGIVTQITIWEKLSHWQTKKVA